MTSAPPAARDDHTQRFKQYAWSMGIRTACFLGAVWCFVGPKWIIPGVALSIGAVVLPAIAVLVANATGRTRIQALGDVAPIEAPPSHMPHLHLPHVHRPALPSGRGRKH